MSEPLESQIEAAVIRLCRLNGIWCRKFVSPATAGVPDRILACNGKVLFLELKRARSAGGTLTRLQEYEQSLITKAGLNVVTTFGLQEAIEKVSDFFAEELEKP